MAGFDISVPAFAKELREALELSNFVFRTSRGKEPLMGDFYPHLLNPGNMKRVNLVRVEGKPVSMAAWLREDAFFAGGSLRIGKVGSVATHPDYRGRGYSTGIMRKMLADMKREGCALGLLWTGSPDFYRRIGFEQGGLAYSAKVQRIKAPRNFYVREGSLEADLPVVERMPGCAAYRSVRSVTCWKQLLGIPGWRILIAEEEDRPVAWGVEKHGMDGGCSLGGWGGLPEAVTVIVGRILDDNDEPVGITASRFDWALRGLLARQGIEWTERQTGMYAIVDAERFCEGTAPYFLSAGLRPPSLREMDEGFRLEAGSKALQLNPGEAVTVLLGPSDEGLRGKLPDAYQRLLPVPLFCAAMDHV